MQTAKIALLASIAFGAAAPLWADADEPYPLEYFALRPVMNNVTVSPSAEHVAMLKILSKAGDPILHIYDADDLDGDPFVVNSDPMEITSYYWASDEHIIMTLRQRVRDLVKGQEQSAYAYRVAILDVVDEEFDDFDAAGPAVAHLLPGVPNKVIISEQPGGKEDLSLDKAFRPRAYYEVDLERGTKKLLIRGKLDVGQIAFDSDGNPRIARGYDVRNEEYLHLYRDPGEKKWEVMRRVSIDDYELGLEYFYPFFQGFDDAVPGNLIVQAFNGDDKRGLWSFNPKTGEFEELLYRRSDADVLGVRYHSNYWAYPGKVTAAYYSTDKHHFEYFDEVEGATFRQLEELIPNSHYVSIPSRSRDGNSLIARNLGPHDPGSYYLLHDGEFQFIGSHQPLLEPDELADVEYFKFKARDGRTIPAFVTKPKGEGPFPLVVLPHGGPHVQETIIYDEWSQMLANNGFLVVQPQYRMSLGYGMEHYLTAWVNGSEAGRKMQDDKDDAALYLVEQGLADPDRMAMFGWSYGGYAALVAASRTPQIYQCTIAGAAVADYVRAANDGIRGFEPKGITKKWTEDYEYSAVQPVEEVEKVNVPILLIHGSIDSRVLPNQARAYRKELDKHGKYYKFVELEGADHFSNTLFYEHQLELYESIIDFLHNDCGMKTPQTELHASAGD